jgi:putative membrane protein
MEYKRVVVICVDRDADIQTKVGEEGPVYGRKSVLSIAQKLGLADPLETDTNALYEAVRLYEDYKKQGVEAEVVAVIGSPELGLKSDTKLSQQLDDVLEKSRAEGAVVVSDGAEDEYILPLVQSRIRIISVRRVVVKQSEKLESTYYLLQDFLKEIVNDPKLSRLMIGLPGIALMLYMLFGSHGWRLIFGIVGVFLVIKGFGMENAVEKGFGEFKSSFVTGKISFFTYVVAALIALVGVVVGYDQLNRMGVPFSNLPNSVPIFISESIDLFTFAAIVALIGKSIDAVLEKESLLKYALLGVFVIAFRIIIEAISLFMLGKINYLNLALWITLGLILTMLSFLSIRATLKAKKTKRGAS